MAETVAALYTLALQQETRLHAEMALAAALIVPPFTPKRRALIRAGFGKVHLLHARLNETWLRQLHLPSVGGLPYFGAERVYFEQLRRRLNLWVELNGLLHKIMIAPRLPVIAALTPQISPMERQLRAFEGALYHLHDYLSPPRPNAEDHVGKHHDIPLPFTHFARLMQLARRTALALGRTAPVSFLDVGCGVGLKVLQAAQVFEIAQGLEYDNSRVVVADKLMRNARRPDDKVFQADAISYDGYGGFDVIYAYKPLSALDLLIQMEQGIVAQAKPGTVLVMPYTEFEERFQDMGCGRVARLVYVTGYKDRDMKPLLRKIARIGFIVPDDPTSRQFDEGFVAPLAKALRHWGHLA